MVRDAAFSPQKSGKAVTDLPARISCAHQVPLSIIRTLLGNDCIIVTSAMLAF